MNDKIDKSKKSDLQKNTLSGRPNLLPAFCRQRDTLEF